MANSPDVSSYKDLTVFDEDPVAILNTILEGGRALLPNWAPQAGQIEVVLAEIFADRTAQLAASINRLPSTTTEVLLQLFGITRSDGTKATGTINITQFQASTIPANTRFLYTDAVSGISYIFVLDSDFTLASGTAAVTALDVGDGYNLSTNEGALSLLSGSAFFQSATFTATGDPFGGTNPETDATYFSRGAALLASYTTATTTDSQIKNYVGTNKTYAYRVATYNRRKYRDRDTTSLSYGVHDGHVLVAVGGQVSTAAEAATEVVVSASNLLDLHTSLEARTPSGLAVEVMTAELAKIHVTVTVKKLDGYTDSSVSTAVENALKGYLDPNVWNWENQRVRRHEIIALIDNVDGVDYVDTLTMDAVSVVGSNNVGYYSLSGGTKTTVNLDITGTDANTSFSPGTLGFYYVDADVEPPVLYEFVNTATFTTDANGGSPNQPFEAVANGLNFNDTANGGKIASGATLPGTGIVATNLGSATKNSGSEYTGGSDDTSQFTVLNNAVATTATAVSEDIYLKNLGTLVTFGDLSVTVT